MVSNFPDNLKVLKARIQSFRRGTKFISYSEGSRFAQTLDVLQEDILCLRESNPQACFTLMDLFVGLHESVLNRADDSDGSVGDAFRGAVQNWLAVAEDYMKLPSCKVDWLALIRDKHNSNNFGIWDDLIANSLGVLTEEQLRQLASEFEQIAHNSQVTHAEKSWNPVELRASIGMSNVARALGDVALYEKAKSLGSPVLNELQILDVVRFCLSVKNGQRALHWLESRSWSDRFVEDRQSLLDETFVLLGHREKLLGLRKARYEALPDFRRLTALLEVMPESERVALQSDAKAKAVGIPNLSVRVQTLLDMSAPELAAQQITEIPSNCAAIPYFYLLDWAKQFALSSHFVAEVLCYRTLLEQILRDARSKAYGHAADYFQRLCKLDTKAQGYYPLSDHKLYLIDLRRLHGRKTAFWARVD